MTEVLDKNCDVVVIGAGLSGLSCARLLQDQGQDVIVLEAAERVGGRLHTDYNKNVGYVDLGGAYVGPTQDRVFRLAREMGLKFYGVCREGDVIYYRKGKSNRFSGVFPPLGSITAFMDMSTFLKKLNSSIEKVSAAEPWNSPDAEKLDQVTLQEWYDKHIYTDATMADAKLISRINFTAEPYEISLLWALWYIRQAQGPYRINAIEGGAQERKFVGGSQQLPNRISEQLGKDKVLLDHPVVDISQNPDGVSVRTSNGRVFTAKHVILAIAPILQNKIRFDPPLPGIRNQLIQRVPMGSIIKTVLYYDQPYWKQKGLCGMTLIEDDDPDHPIEGTFDDTKPDGSFPAIIGFLVAGKVENVCHLTKEERCKKIAQSYVKVFQCPEMANPIHYEEKNWNVEPWSGGCYTGFMGPGILTRYGRALREPIGRIYFAGTETATEWTGYMEGAIQAGERAAREVLHANGLIKKEDIYQPEPPTEGIDTSLPPLSLLERLSPSVPSFYKFLGLTLLVGALVAKAKL